MAEESRVVSATEHYDLLIEEGNDPFNDGDLMQQYMSRWDGPLFFEALGSTSGKDILEVGVGTGRLARRVLEKGYGSFTGLDASKRTIDRARENLRPYQNVQLVLGNIEEHRFCTRFDVAYSVLTFMHIERKRDALANMVGSLRPGGILVLSLSCETGWLDYGSRRVRLHLAPIEDYVGWLTDLGCFVDPPVELMDQALCVDRDSKEDSTSSMRRRDKVATLLRAQKRYLYQPEISMSADRQCRV